MWRKEDVIKKLREKQGAQSLRSYADSIDCSAAYLSDVYNNRREPGKKLLDTLGLEAVVVKTIIYQPKQLRWRKEDE